MKKGVCKNILYSNAIQLIKNNEVKVIDVRDNPGGVFSEVINIADMLVPEGVVVTYEGNEVSEPGVYTVKAHLYDAAGNELKVLEATITITEITKAMLEAAVFDPLETDPLPFL